MRGKIFVHTPLAAVLFLCVAGGVFSQDSGGPALLLREARGPYSLVERSDWSRYENGKYIGHVYREVRASIIPQDRGSAGLQYRGNFFVMEETLRDMRQSARAVDEVIPVSFRMNSEGAFVIDDDRGFPEFRNFPAFPAGAIEPGSKWTARGNRSVDPLHEGDPVIVPLVAEYEYRGVEEYRDIPVHRVFAKYALRFEGQSSIDRPGREQNGREQNGGQSSTQGQGFQVRGTHNVDILLRVSDGIPLMMRDNLDDTYTWPNGFTVRFRGFTLTFGDGLVPLDKEAIVSGAKRRTFPADSGIDISSVPEGVKLTINDIRFEPDSDEILASERPRLDMIARVLQESPGRTFLVEGHTAAIGRPAGEMELSVRRAKRMAAELANLGISIERFIYKGWGGTKPLRDNATDEGRRLNRRVEITILE
ncbi:MAG: OmpA family protein [Treponema sp.]|jgi:outer membrane protein OmpA-like peptidoglycan-associated protein|nr:OmpA family protein [Treponema sp.]